MCSFLNNDDENKYGWILGKGRQNTTDPGPPSDNTLGNEHGSYLFVNLTAARMANVQLQTVTLKYDFCLRFFYYMYGSEVSLFKVVAQNVHISYKSDNINYFIKDKSQGERWKEVVVTIASTSAMKTLGYEVRFEMTKISNTSTKCVVALDDIELNRGKCPEQTIRPEFLCTFDSYNCGYSSKSTSPKTWNWKKGLETSKYFDKQPAYDNTLDTKYGGYWVAGIDESAFRATTPVTSSVLSSPVFAKPKSPLNCLYFYFWMDGDGNNWIWGEVEEAYLQAHVNFPDSPNTDRHWLVTKAKNDTQQREWVYVELNVNLTEKFEFQFTAMIKSGIAASVAIDDVKLLPGICSGAECDCGPEGTCSFSKEGDKLCECKRSFAEKDGICAKCDCGLGGTCSFNEEGNKVCSCKKNYVVKDGICVECDCGPEGTCSFNKKGNKQCACKENYAVLYGRCEECDCSSNGELPVGCEFIDGKKECKCPMFEAQKDDRCVSCDCGPNVSCTFTLGWNSYEKSCICPEGYQEVDQRCEVIKSTPTVAVISTPGQLSSTVNELFSETTEGIRGSTAISTSTVAPECYCGEHSESCYFDRSSNKVCICFEGYAQRNKTCAGTCFGNRDCLNGGVCRRGEGAAYFCSCRPHFKGDSCETNELCDRLNPACEVIGAECRVVGNKAKCECPPGKTYIYRSGLCEDLCDSNRCLHGTCEVKGENYECKCDEGFSGRFCEERRVIIPDICACNRCLHGTCVVKGENYECKCDEGFSGRFCEERRLIIPGYSYLWIVYVALFNVTLVFLIASTCLYCKSKRNKEKLPC